MSIRFWMLVASLLAIGLVACEPDPERPEDDDDSTGDDDDDDSVEEFDYTLYEVIEYELTEKFGEAYRGTDDAESVYSAVRYRLETPMTVVGIGAMYNVRADDDLPAHLAIWPDNGHNFFDFGRDAPLAEWEFQLNKDEHDEVWQHLALPETIEIAYPQLLYVGNHYRGEPGQSVLATDMLDSVDPYLAAHAGEDDQYPPHVAVLPDRGTNEYGFEAVSFAAPGGGVSGDLLVRLYVERHDVVEEGDTWFVDATGEEAGLSGSGNVAFGDCDGDGNMDVFDGRLRQGDGTGAFFDITDLSGIEVGGNGMWGDYNNDGNLDLFVARWDDRLYEGQGGCNFVDVTAASGIDDTQEYTTGDGTLDQHVPTVAPAWVDVNGDGLLDLVQANFGDFGTSDWAKDFLWINQGDGLFVDGTSDAGMSTPQGAGKAGRAAASADWDNDGDMDVYVGNYRLHRNFAWLNDGDGEFTDAGRDNWLEGHADEYAPLSYYYGHTIGVAWGDVDNDEDLDLFTGNLSHPRFSLFSDKSMFLRNNLAETGEATFDNVRDEAGMLYQETDSSPMFLDYDNDGFLDLFYTAVYPARPSYLMHNNGDFTFEMVSYPAGTWIYSGWGVSSADIDNDGDLDIYGGRLFVNEHPELGGSVKVKAVGGGTGATNVSAIGARIRVTTDDGTQMREVSAGMGVGCQQPFEQHFGLGGATSATVEVEFPVTGTVIDVGTVADGDRLVVYEDGTIENR